MPSIDYKNIACIVGVGQSPYALQVNRSPVSLQTEAFRNALEDAGLDKGQIDGFSTAHGAPTGVDYDEFVAHAGLEIRWALQHQDHGRWSSTSLASAALAVASGFANYVAICNTTLSHRGYGKFFQPYARGGWGENKRDVTGGHGEIDWVGLDTPGSGTSLAARMYFEKYGATSEELATVALTFRKHANMNPAAIMYDRPMDLDDYMESRWITPPYRLFDYCLRNEGSTCLIVTTPERARDLKQTPVFLSGFQGVGSSRNDFHNYARPGLPLGFQEEFDYVAPEQPVYGVAGVEQGDIDALYMYDSFSTNLWMVLERFGFCKAGEAHEFIQGGRIALGGELPVNTNGGLMSEGHYSGYNHIIEMVRQLRGEAGPRQLPNPEVLQWATSFGDSTILTKG